MKERSVFTILQACALCAGGVVACSSDPCFPNTNGKEYRVSIIEVWDSNSQFPGGITTAITCPLDLDLVAGGGFDIKVDGFNSGTDGCECGKGTISRAPDGWQWTDGDAGGRCGTNFFQANLTATQGSCVGQVGLLVSANRVPTGGAVPGKAPVAYVDRNFVGGPSCSVTSCDNRLVAEIAEL